MASFGFLRNHTSSGCKAGFGVLFLYHQFHLKPTRCAKGTTSDPRTCQFRNDRPLKDCAVCYNAVSGQIETNPDPCVHCIQKPRLTKAGFGVQFLYHQFHLKPTRCAKGTTSDPRTCQFRNDRPLMDCAVCYKAVSGQIEANPDPYLHCIQKPRLTKEMMTTREDHWKKMTYATGAATIMALSTG